MQLPFSKKETSQLQEKLEEQMLGLFEQVIKDRSKYFDENSDKVPTPESISAIINSYANQNAVISGGAGMVPGPLGMLAIVPELVLIIRNQLSMVYDIGYAYGYGKKMNSEILISVFSYSLGAGALGLMAIHGQKILIKRASLRLMQRIVRLMAGKISQRVLKSMVGKWVPVLGAVALATWSKFATHDIGKKAVLIFEKDIEFSDLVEDVAEGDISTSQDNASTVDEADDPEVGKFDEIKVKALINLMIMDGELSHEEQKFIASIIENADLTSEDKLVYVGHLNSKKKFKIDLSVLKDSPDDVVGLLTDMIALAKKDGDFHLTERLYIRQAAKNMSLEEEDLKLIMSK
ncbi:MAG: TerB family tellurite resistance protein [Cyanobacteria bacterium P01_F01_bin.150]